MTSLTPDQVAQKWSNNLVNAQDTIKAGVMATTVSPMAKAAAQSQKYLNGVQAAVQSGKWQRGLQRVQLADWQNAIINKGLARLSSGAQQAQGKMSSFMAQWLPALAANVAKVKQMPSATLQDRIQRAVAMMQANSQFKRTQ